MMPLSFRVWRISCLPGDSSHHHEIGLQIVHRSGVGAAFPPGIRDETGHRLNYVRLKPNFTGTGRTITDNEGCYRFVTIMPGHYPWGNHHNAWRPAHIHFSVLGPGFLTRLVTQMYFPGDPLQPLDPIFNSVRDPEVRQRMVSSFDIGLTSPDWALGFRWDIVLRGRDATPALA